MEVEISVLIRKYTSLRIWHCRRQAELLASLSEHGQRQPVLVVRAQEVENRYVLIDGYKRVRALEKIGTDVVDATVLDMDEAAGLICAYSFERRSSISAVEEGWLLKELVTVYGKSQNELAERFARSVSWVSRRLSLVSDLPDPVQKALATGRICAHAAEKYLAVLARANAQHCEQLVQNLGERRMREREIEKLYVAWRAGNKEQREHIVENPILYLQLEKQDKVDNDQDQEPVLLRELGQLAAVCRRIREHLCERTAEEKKSPLPLALRMAWRDAEVAFSGLSEIINRRAAHA